MQFPKKKTLIVKRSQKPVNRMTVVNCDKFF